MEALCSVIVTCPCCVAEETRHLGSKAVNGGPLQDERGAGMSLICNPRVNLHV